MSELKPCPFCGGVDKLVYDATGYFVCNSCGAFGPDKGNNYEEEAEVKLKAAELWNTRAHIPEPPVVMCEFPNCGKPADYEGWYRRRDPFLGTPSGHIVRIAFCESCKSHPHLCVNEPKPKKKDTET